MRLATMLFALVLPGAVFAQTAELGFHGGAHRVGNASLGLFPDGSNIALDSSWLFGFHVALNNYRFFGHEMGYTYNRTNWLQSVRGASVSQVGTAIHRGTYNFVVHATPEGSSIRPYVGAGGHFQNFVFPGYSGVYGGGSTKFGLNYGGGLKFRVSPALGLRFDLHDYRTAKPFKNLFINRSGLVRQVQFSIGFSLLL